MAAISPDSKHLSAMPDVMVPSTPPPQPIHTSNSVEITPPPSTQPLRINPATTQSKSAQRTLFPQSPPTTIKTGTDQPLPTSDDISKAEHDELRKMAQELSHAVAEARMLAAHYKLQYNFLTIESQESAQRADIEHQMTRREVEVLQSAQHNHSVHSAALHTIMQPLAQSQTDALSRTCKDLEEERDELDHKLRNAKAVIEQLMDRADFLDEENLMLKKRIRENREHFNEMRRSPAFHSLALTPRNDFATPQRKPVPQFAESARPHDSSRNQDPFAALLAADQMLNSEAASLPATPTKTHSTGFRQCHNRGAFSLSSLQTTPVQLRAVTVGETDNRNKGSAIQRLASFAPSAQLAGLQESRDHRDRDSTISVSDEEALTDENLPQSQASSLAASMLRRNPGSQDSPRIPEKAEKSSKALQTKIFGQVKKAGIERKRHASFGQADGMKKTKLAEGVGLGIGTWGT